jgi:glutaredoxin-like protein NrdH
MTKKYLDKEGIEYTVEDLQSEANYDKLVEFVEQGFKAAPIVVTDTETWSGYKVDKLKEINQ